MRKLSIIHFQEIEKFPPIINLLRYLSSSVNSPLHIEVLTTASDLKQIDAIPGIRILRLARWYKGMGRLGRTLLYLRFNLLALARMMKFSPDVMLYYETFSAGSSWLYKSFFKKKVKLFIHYHEYISPAEYKQGMVMNRWFHELEKKLYPKSEWVSHTNADRMRFFLEDVSGHEPHQVYTLPNFPPASWKRQTGKKIDRRIGFVYVGALGLDTMYVKEMAEYVAARPDECYWDIYSSNHTGEVIDFIQKFDHANISFKGGVSYDDLPDLLSQYNVGLVLYKGHVPNYVYNAPNKLFEYHVCGLDVWFPHTMKSAMEYETSGTYPKIVPVNFADLGSMNLRNETDHSSLTYRQFDFSSEAVFERLRDKLLDGASNAE